MKIIGLTHNAYLVEMTPRELRDISGNELADESWSRPNTRLHGATLEVNKTWEYLRRIQSTETERAKIAESLNAAATLIANTPLVLTLPVPPEPVQGDTQDRI